MVIVRVIGGIKVGIGGIVSIGDIDSNILRKGIISYGNVVVFVISIANTDIDVGVGVSIGGISNPACVRGRRRGIADIGR